MLSADGVCAPSIAGFAAVLLDLLKPRELASVQCVWKPRDTTALTCLHASAFVLVAAMPPLFVYRDRLVLLNRTSTEWKITIILLSELEIS